MKAREEVTVSQLFQVLELTVSDGPKELKIREDKFKALWVCATPDVRRAHNQNGHTVLHTMVIYGFEALIHDVLQEMPELALKHAKDGEYPIHTAVENHHIGVVQLLLNVPGVAHLKNRIGQTALHYAARFGLQEMVLLCCKKRVGNIDERDRAGKTPLTLARRDNSPDVEVVLIAQGADENLVEF
ncbi:MAG: ankyrin repeat domain-containing protein [Legionellaceae bacterium]|nr:ankyrin repeat domain-containing protein [Legionellaceae bacterium]